MKYDITYTCGHTGKIELFGKNTDREWRIKQEESRPCLACANKTNADANKAAGLPALTGSAKQIAWAESIRASGITMTEKAFAENDERLERAADLANHPERAAEMAQRSELIGSEFARLMAELTEAKWWIDNRNDIPKAIGALIVPKLKELSKANQQK